MKVDEIARIIHDNRDVITSEDGIKTILNRSNNLNSLNYINRIVIFSQCRDAFDVRTAEQWEMSGLNIKKGSKPLYIVKPIYKKSYIRSKTGDIIEDMDLNSLEIASAIDYGVIEIESLINELETIPVFDIKQVEFKGKYSDVINRQINTEKVIKLFESITHCKVSKADETYYSKSKNLLYLSNLGYKGTVEIVSETLADYLMETNSKLLKDINEPILKNALTFSIETLLLVNSNRSISNFSNLENFEIVNILDAIDALIYNVNTQLYDIGVIQSVDYMYDIEGIKRSNILLNIMESNSIHKRISCE